MNQLRLAIKGYDGLVDALQNTRDESASDQAEAWLRDEVCPLVKQLARSRSFQLAATWSLDQLAPGVNTTNRKLVVAVDNALIQFAKALVVDSQGKTIVEQPVWLNLPARVRADLADVEWIARRPWFDLVAPEEYFQAHRGLNLLDPESKHDTQFDQICDLGFPLGDFVLRSMLARVDYWQQLLADYSNRLLVANCRAATGAEWVTREVVEAQSTLDAAVAKLRLACLSDESRIRRESAVVLTQVYVADSVLPRLDWHPYAEVIEPFGDCIRFVVRRLHNVHIVEPLSGGGFKEVGSEVANLCFPVVIRQIAGALNDAAVFDEALEDPDFLIDWAKDRVRLLLVDCSSRAVYWDGKLLAGKWDHAQTAWYLLWALATNVGHRVTQEMLPKPEINAIRSRRYQLQNLLGDAGIGLNLLIEAISGPAYILNLPREALGFLRDDGTGRLVSD